MNRILSAEEQLFTPDHCAFRDSVIRFVNERANPNAHAWNEAGAIPRSVWREMGELGFLGTAYDARFGGSNGDLMYSVVLAEELTRSRVSGLSFAVCDHKDMSSNYILEGSEELQNRYLPGCVSGEMICGIAITEPSGGSDVAAIRTTATRSGNQEYVLNGQKTFITNGINADIIIVAARTNPNAARPRDGISLFVVETNAPGFSRGPALKKMGNLASDTAELFFNDCRIPVGNLIGEEHQGFKILMADLGLERLIACAIYIAACEEMLKITVNYTRERKVFGQAVADFQVNRHKFAELFTETALAKTFYYDCCRRSMRGDRLVKEISMIKYFASELANRIAYACVSLHGGWGYMKEYPISQWYSDVRLFNIGAGTTEIMKDIIAREVLS